MSAISDSTSTGVKPTVSQIARATGLAILTAVIVNVVIYFIAAAIGWLPAEGVQGDVTLIPVVLASVVPVVVGAAIYYGLTRFLAYTRANNIFVIIASVVLLLMVASPLTGLVDPTFSSVFVLQIMHLVVGLPAMYFLTNSAG